MRWYLGIIKLIPLETKRGQRLDVILWQNHPLESCCFVHVIRIDHWSTMQLYVSVSQTQHTDLIHRLQLTDISQITNIMLA